MTYLKVQTYIKRKKNEFKMQINYNYFYIITEIKMLINIVN